MILNYIWCKDGKMHYNTLAGFNTNGKWTFTDVMHDNYVLEDNFEFIYNIDEHYYGIVAFADKVDIDLCKVLLTIELNNLAHYLESIIDEISSVKILLGGKNN